MVDVLAFGTLGMGHRGHWGQLLAAEKFYTQREEDLGLNKGVLVAN